LVTENHASSKKDVLNVNEQLHHHEVLKLSTMDHDSNKNAVVQAIAKTVPHSTLSDAHDAQAVDLLSDGDLEMSGSQQFDTDLDHSLLFATTTSISKSDILHSKMDSRQSKQNINQELMNEDADPELFEVHHVNG
jgi:hypothetical protein